MTRTKKTKLFVILAVVLLVAGILAYLAFHPQPPLLFLIDQQVTVKDSLTNQPISGATIVVFFIKADSYQPVQYYTDSLGNARIYAANYDFISVGAWKCVASGYQTESGTGLPPRTIYLTGESGPTPTPSPTTSPTPSPTPTPPPPEFSWLLFAVILCIIVGTIFLLLVKKKKLFFF